MMMRRVSDLDCHDQVILDLSGSSGPKRYQVERLFFQGPDLFLKLSSVRNPLPVRMHDMIEVYTDYP